MKKKLLILLTPLLIALSVVACGTSEPDGGIEDDGNKDNEENVQPRLTPGIYQFIAPAMKGSWEEGDEIYVRGGTGATAVTISLKASDLSDGGRTASVRLEDVTADDLDPDGLYAAWPADAVKQSYGVLNRKTTFKAFDRLLAVAFLDGDSFRFIDVNSAIEFTLNGYDSYAIAVSNREGLNFTSLVVEHTSEKTAMTTKNDGYPFKYGEIAAAGKTRILFPGDITLGGGYTLYFCKDGKWCASYSSADEVSLKAGNPLDLGDLGAKISTYDGLEPKMPVMGESTKYTIEDLYELSGLCLSEDEDFLWAVGDEGDLAIISFEGDLLSNVHIGGDAEAVSRHPETGDLLIGLEPDGVGIVKGPDFNSHVKSLFSLAKAKDYGNAGIEGLTYYKDNMIYVGTQTDSRLFLCNLETGEVIWDKAMYDRKCVSEIADLAYDPLTDWLWILDSEAKKFFAFNADATQLLGAYSVSSIGNPESICIDHKNSCIWIGDDNDKSYLYKFEFTGLDDAIISNK